MRWFRTNVQNMMKNPKKRRLIGISILIILWLPVLFILGVNYNFLGLFGEMPDLSQLEHPSTASEIYTSDSLLIGRYYQYNRVYTKQQDISKHTFHAVLATYGKNLAGAVNELSYRCYSYSSGKGFFENAWIVKKIKEWFIQLKIRRTYSKEEIIQMYVNLSYFGHNICGIYTASKSFFDKEPKDLNPTESAILVGLLKAPTHYSPISNPQKCMQRRNKVLQKMQEYQFISLVEYHKYVKNPIQLKYGFMTMSGIAPHFKHEAEKFLIGWAKEKGYNLYTDGLKIYTTIDSKMQKYAQEAVLETMVKKQEVFYMRWKGRNPWVDVWNKEIPGYIERETKRSQRYKELQYQYGKDTVKINKIMNTPIPMRVYKWSKKGFYEKDTIMSPIDSIKYYKHFLQAGFMVMEPNTGQIKAWVGNLNHQHFPYDRVKQSTRQSGKLFHAIAFSAALDNGFTPCSRVKAEPIGGYGASPNTIYSGAMLNLKQAMSISTGSGAEYGVVRTLLKTFGPSILTEYARSLGIQSHLDTNITTFLGSHDVSLYEMLGMYCTFANEGRHNTPQFITRIEDRNGKIIEEFKPENRKAIDEDIAYQMLDMLLSTTKSGGTAIGIHAWGKDNQSNPGWHNEVAAKTGNSQNNADAWFVGLTPTLAGGVWVGGDGRANRFESRVDGQGGILALPIWGSFFAKIYADKTLRKRYPKGVFKKPDGFSIELDCNKVKNEAKLDE
jgi:penicillin-binding protein 1A